MTTKWFATQVLGLSFVLAMGPWMALSSDAADQAGKGARVSVPANALSQVATGAVEDTLKACLARIPAVATVGQRLLAERSCTHEDGARTLSADAVKF